jgi:RNA polymerase sigma-70 factor (ECF subfamily)
MAGAAQAKRPKLWLAAKDGGAQPAPASVPPPPAAPTLDDSELLTALRAGDPSAATAFHDRTRPQVDRTLRRLLGRNDQDLEDLAQLAMIELVYTIDRYRGDCSLDAWTATLTAHVVYKHIRRRQTERRIFGAIAPEDLVVASPQRAGREAMVRDVMKKVLTHLDRMDENRAWTYVLHDVCGYDLNEIATITGVSVAAAQSRLVRGRRELHERIQADPELASRMSELEGE